MTRNRRILIPLIIFITYANGCSLFSGNTRIDEVVFASTEVGTPEGDKVTKEIGPAGGSLASPDGRLTLTVPQNALTETLSFSIQPITNKFGGGIGLAYRLEPSGKTFSTPFQVSVHYNDHDLEGTISEGLSLAYQDGQGAWHLQKSSRLDKEKKTLTVSTIHFSDWSFLTRLKLSPSKTSLHVGETLFIGLFLCEEPVLLDKILSRPAKSMRSR